jgi:hypothetical protein
MTMVPQRHLHVSNSLQLCFIDIVGFITDKSLQNIFNTITSHESMLSDNFYWTSTDSYAVTQAIQKRVFATFSDRGILPNWMTICNNTVLH